MKSGTPRKGLVYSIQRYCIHDGPGIRTDVFLKGCSLHCPWCSNPESQRPEPELSFLANKCCGCGVCFEKCKENALRREGGFRIDRGKCTGCGVCVRYCARDCYQLYGKEYTAQELLCEASKDDIFYQNSGGGVTVTGGEPTDQYEFVVEFLALCKEAGLDTAMETHGFSLEERYVEAAPYVDHFLIDLKHTDLRKCHDVTGSPLNVSPMENMRVLAGRYGKEVSIRIPVIPGFNDDMENFGHVAEFARELRETGNLRMIHLLPYHNMGSSKYAALNRCYPMGDASALADSEVEPFREFLLSRDLPCIIGG